MGVSIVHNDEATAALVVAIKAPVLNLNLYLELLYDVIICNAYVLVLPVLLIVVIPV